ncbi:MAG TPA: choice-of-anchor tandem repeat GloVer-containing protein [Terriglobales bacterium]
MPQLPTLNILQSIRKPSPRLVIACAVLMVFAAAPLHGQYGYLDIYNFNCSTDGCNAINKGQLTEGSDLYLYGTTVDGGANNIGTLFKVSADGTTFVKLWDFDGTNSGASPENALTLASDGYFYGATPAGGNFGNGTLFRIGSSGSASPGPPTVLHHFDPSESLVGSLAMQPTQAKDGNLYGVTGNGTTYRFNLPTQTYQLLTNSVPGPTVTPLLLASNGYLYGVGTSDTIFSIATPGGVVHVVHNFTGGDGSLPEGLLTELRNPRCKPFMRCILLYGTTTLGGANDTGDIFEVSPSGAFKVLHNFAAVSGTETNIDGASPEAGLLLAPNGQLLGVAENGGTFGEGTIFEISTAGSFTKLFDFAGNGGPIYGAFPPTTLVQHTNGCLYGLTNGGGLGVEGGNVYYLCPPSPPDPIPILIVEGPIFVGPGVPVQIIGSDMAQVSTLTFGGVKAQFQPVSDTLLSATVPMNAVDGFVVATFPSGAQVQSEKQMYILPTITNLDPTSGPVGQEVDIVGGGFAGATRVAFGGVKATSFTVLSPSLIQTTVPTGAKTGKVSVTTPNGTAVSKQTFTVN